MDNRIAVWLLELEVSNFPKSIPMDIYEIVKKELWRSFRRDHSMVVDEFSFYYSLSPKMQNEVVELLFSDFLSDFSELFEGCEPQFINNIVVMLRFSCYTHGQMIQSANFEAE